jgi:hypothetical protein
MQLLPWRPQRVPRLLVVVVDVVASVETMPLSAVDYRADRAAILGRVEWMLQTIHY